ncbi:hypothetical protein NKI61_06010 [Mesorhizobium sp. M0514]|uniref:hypothetical protein n=1 Tax=Mesorhizobium sp. M0514 TaxID=2956955 RepID=UPI00333A81A4
MTDKKGTTKTVQQAAVKKGYSPTKSNVQGGYKPVSGGGGPKVTPTTSSGGKKK